MVVGLSILGESYELSFGSEVNEVDLSGSKALYFANGSAGDGTALRAASVVMQLEDQLAMDPRPDISSLEQFRS